MNPTVLSETDFKQHGFLSKHLDPFQQSYRQQFAADFAAVEKLSSFATGQLFAVDLGTQPTHIVLAVSFWSRCLSACQGATLLIERGMSADGQTLIRVASEFLFFAVALLKDPYVMERITGQEIADKLKQAKGMLQDGIAGGHLTDQQVAAIEDFIASTPPSKVSISAYDAAEIAQLKYLYQTIYRGLSLTSSHATLTSTNHFFVEDAGQVGMEFGPSPAGIRWSLSLVSTCLQAGLTHFSSLLN